MRSKKNINSNICEEQERAVERYVTSERHHPTELTEFSPAQLIILGVGVRKVDFRINPRLKDCGISTSAKQRSSGNDPIS